MRLPVDIEEGGVAAGRAVLQHVPPVAVLLAQRHVVGHDVQHLAQPSLAQPLAEALVRLRAAQLLVDPAVIDHVIAMHAARRRLQIRRAVDVRDAEVAKIFGDGRGVLKGESLMELQPISGSRNSQHNNRRRSRVYLVEVRTCREGCRFHKPSACNRVRCAPQGLWLYPRDESSPRKRVTVSDFNLAAPVIRVLWLPVTGKRERRMRHRDMRKRLGKVAHHPLCNGVVLLRQKAYIIP